MAEARDKNDIAIAHKALLLCKGLSAADKEVGAAILGHFNKKTGQCDPSIARLSKLLEINEKTVRLATLELCARGLFSKASHGGKSFRASYSPKWSAFRAIVTDWDHRMRCVGEPENGGENRAKMPADPGRKCPVTPGENALQTHISNPYNKPISLKSASMPSNSGPKTPRSGQAELGLLKVKDDGPSHRNFLSRERAVTGTSRAEAAWSAADYRLVDAINNLDKAIVASVWAWLTEATLNAAITAEMHRRGDGLMFIKREMLADRLKSAEVGSHVH